MDVINNAIIYQPADVTLVGDVRALGTRATPARRSTTPASRSVRCSRQSVVEIRSSSPSTTSSRRDRRPGPRRRRGDGQGTSNDSRVRQATALRDWVAAVLPTSPRLVEDVFLIGDFNSYTQEDPLQVLYAAGFADVNAWRGASSEYSYSFAGLSGSLDHVLANGSAMARVTGSDIWNINSPESIALEYSRYNYHGSLFYDESPSVRAITIR